MQTPLKRFVGWIQQLAGTLLVMGGWVLVILTSPHHYLSIADLHRRWILIEATVAVVVMFFYIIFVWSFRDRLNTQNRILLFFFAALSAASWSAFYILLDPASKPVVGGEFPLVILSLVVSFLVSIAFIGVLGLIVDRKPRNVRSRLIDLDASNRVNTAGGADLNP